MKPARESPFLALGTAAALIVVTILAWHLMVPAVSVLDRLLPVTGPRDRLFEAAAPNDTVRRYVIWVVIATVLFVTYEIGSSRLRGLGRQYLAWAISAMVCVVAGFEGTFVAAATPLTVAIIALVAARPLRGPVFRRDSAKPASVASVRTMTLAFVTSTEMACACWGVWLASVRYDVRIVGAAVCATGFATARPLFRLLMKQPQRVRLATLDARAGVVLCAMPLLALFRSPSPLAAGGFVLAYLVLRNTTIPMRARWLTPLRLGAIASFGIFSVFSIPLKLRELPLNFDGHEAGQYAWINSALHGKWLMADASTIYGPLREYVLVALIAIFGKTAANERLAQVVVNLAGLALLAPLLWRLARRRIPLVLLGIYLVLIFTHLYTFLDAGSNYSFGWADFGRIAFPTAIGAFVVRSAGAGTRTWTFVLSAALGLTCFYVQELGPVVVIAALGAIVGSLLFAARSPFSEERSAAWRTVGTMVGGVSCGVLAFVLPYVIAGKGVLLLKTIALTASLFSSGLGALPFPVRIADLASWKQMFAETRVGGLRIEYLVAPAIYLCSLAVIVPACVRRQWSGRTSLMCFLFLFGVGSFRVALGRSDLGHLLSVTLPAVLLFVGLASDAVDTWTSGLIPGGVTRFPVGTATLIAFLWASTACAGFVHGLRPKVVGILHHTEVPSFGAPYVYPDVPRAGDMLVPQTTIDVVRYVRQHTASGEAIYYRGRQTFGGEYYFLADRRNPTRFDLPHEMFTLDEATEALGDITRDPPSLVLTENASMGGAAMRDYFAAHYVTVARFGRVAIQRPISP